MTLAAGVLALICVAPVVAGTDLAAGPAGGPGAGTQAAGSEKQSPYAAATDDAGSDAPVPLAGPIGGTKAPGSKKSSPYAAAKDSPLLGSPTLGRLWGLLLPLVLAAGSYVFLRSKEGNELA
ncbi:hypothetical protein [Cyanobium sp. ATX-6F1]|uniref:hypothetical protein n=1 Tax=Cyanobium sp. ATX-6F1 TaxID=3137388 RepID=UPI0039BDBB2F